jgi:NYN domain
MHLVIGAMDIAHRGLATHFLIVSNDRDFGPLADHLREIGMQVEWAVKPKPAPKPAAVPVSSKAKALSAVDQRLHTLFQSQKPSLSLQALGSQMKHGTVVAQTQKPTWRAYLKTKPELYSLAGDGAATIVTLKTP